MVLRLSLFTSQSPWWYSDYQYTHNSLPGGTQTIPLHSSVSFLMLRLSLYTLQSPFWDSDYPYTQPSLPGGLDYPYTHQSLPGGTQTIPLLSTVTLVVLTLSLFSSQSPWWYSDYPYNHHSRPGVTHTIQIHTTVLILYSSQSA